MAQRAKLALIARVDANPAIASFAHGSGFTVRPDGMVMTANHTLSATSGEIYVRLPTLPNTVRMGIVDRNAKDDLALLKPVTPITTTVPHVGLADFKDVVPNSTQVVNMGLQEVNLTASNQLSGQVYLGEGRIFGLDPVHFPGEANRFRYRTNVSSDYGQSGGPTFELGSGKVVGLMLGGRDYKWSGLAPAPVVKDMIRRNWHR